MHILILTQYYYPETAGAAPVFLRELAIDIKAMGHKVTVLTAFPNYPDRIVFQGYQRRLFQREIIDGIEVVRTWIYANPAETYISRILNWGSFCFTSFLGGLFGVSKPDLIYAVLPPLPLGVTATWLGRIKRCPVVANVQDLYPLIAIELGILTNKRLISFFENMEKFVYRNVKALVVISDGFKEHIVSTGTPSEKITVISNWADPNFIQPGPKHNDFHRELGIGDQFSVIYSGGLTRNSCVDMLVRAAAEMKSEPISFVIVGDGAVKAEVEQLAQQIGATNVIFKPFQPLERYPDVLRAADLTVVTLNKAATFASVPSKVFKQMAAGRPILALTNPGNELELLLNSAECGICVNPEELESLVEKLRWAYCNKADLEKMGRNARAYLESFHCRNKCVQSLAMLFESLMGETKKYD